MAGSSSDIVGVLLTVGFVALSAGVLVWALLRQRRLLAAREAAWQELSGEFGGRIHPATGPWYQRKSPRLEVQVSGQPLVLDSHVVSSGKSSTTYTRVQGSVSSPHRMRLYREQVFSRLGKLAGTQDVETGDAVYDAAFMVKSDDPEWVQTVLQEPLREAHLQTPEVSVTLADGVLTLQRVGMVTSHAPLRALLLLAAGFALSISHPSG